jgi:hypothetical protein
MDLIRELSVLFLPVRGGLEIAFWLSIMVVLLIVMAVIP